jgi:hypothetical protein
VRKAVKKKIGSSFAAVAAAAAFILILGGCEREVESFTLRSDNPGNIALQEKPGVPPEREGQLRGSRKDASTPRYRLQKVLDEPSEGNDFVLEYTSSLPAELLLEYEGDKTSMVRLPATGGTVVRMYAPLARPGLKAFRVQADAEVPENSDRTPFRIRAAEIKSGLRGYRRETAVSTGAETAAFSAGVGGSMFGSEVDGEAELFRLRFPEELAEPGRGGRQSVLQLSYRSSKEHAEKIAVLLEGAGETRERYHLFPKEGDHRVYFYGRQLGFTPTGLQVEGVPEEIGIRAAEFSTYSVKRAEIPEPLPADMGTILRYERDHWRRSDWEIFSWNLFPNILVFDFRDYALQARFLKRLAFFVEKEDGAGRLLSDEELSGRHGWNAHDYRAVDLARFYTLARHQQFRLNEQERLLRRILLEHGIIRFEGEGYRAGEGGILSFSQESSPRLRYLFATHEGYHGFFFAAPTFRERVQNIWDGLTEEEQRFWHRFLAWKNYNVDDAYLVVNEFQAYLMQQHLSYVESYFKEYTIPRFLEAYPEYREETEAFLEAHPEHFLSSAEKVQQAALEIAGLSAGDPLCLRTAGE